MPRKAPTHRLVRSAAKLHNPRGHGPKDRQQRRAMHTGSKGWRMLRLVILQRDGFTCAACKHYGDQVDHIDNDSHNNDAGNLQTLCAVCHSSKTRAEQDGRAGQGRGA
jgi:5-methylcytosine-specific restriction endonuclease McrA